MTTVRVNYSFSSSDYSDIPEILSLHEGEILSDVYLLEGGWWYGKKSSGELGYFPCTYITTVDYCENSVIENLETCHIPNLMLLTLELPDPKNENRSTQAQQIEPNFETQAQIAIDRKVITDFNGWLRLTDDISGKQFYFNNGEYAWGE